MKANTPGTGSRRGLNQLGGGGYASQTAPQYRRESPPPLQGAHHNWSRIRPSGPPGPETATGPVRSSRWAEQKKKGVEGCPLPTGTDYRRSGLHHRGVPPSPRERQTVLRRSCSRLMADKHGCRHVGVRKIAWGSATQLSASTTLTSHGTPPSTRPL
ncbi:hypothetical protein NDU88_000757 [Pleurodeles waltl]|uniref:Uncharacterized protein n=1 Tax=Pleurodeles waltl TaxID=8319 RepID=A0AAV7USS6_PLEWA|nr:hypothetical protein NDU88_000757 [Pleurodeles waltl]